MWWHSRPVDMQALLCVRTRTRCVRAQQVRKLQGDTGTQPELCECPVRGATATMYARFECLAPNDTVWMGASQGPAAC